MEGGWGEVMKFFSCLWILPFSNNRSVVHFGDGRCGRVIKVVIFCERLKFEILRSF